MNLAAALELVELDFRLRGNDEKRWRLFYRRTSREA
jgi:hypothetical protein